MSKFKHPIDLKAAADAASSIVPVDVTLAELVKPIRLQNPVLNWSCGSESGASSIPEFGKNHHISICTGAMDNSWCTWRYVMARFCGYLSLGDVSKIVCIYFQDISIQAQTKSWIDASTIRFVNPCEHLDANAAEQEIWGMRMEDWALVCLDGWPNGLQLLVAQWQSSLFEWRLLEVPNGAAF